MKDFIKCVKYTIAGIFGIVVCCGGEYIVKEKILKKRTVEPDNNEDAAVDRSVEEALGQKGE